MTHKRKKVVLNRTTLLIGQTGLEPATPSPPDLYANHLRYCPLRMALYNKYFFYGIVFFKMFDAHCHFKSEDSIVCSAQLLPSMVELPPDYSLVGVSEIGLDKRFVDRIPMEEQVSILSSLLYYAKMKRIPVTLHCVHATQLMVDTLKSFGNWEWRAMWHGFTGSKETAAMLEKMGVLVSIGPRFKGSVSDLGPFVIESDYEGDSETERLGILSGVYNSVSIELGVNVEALDNLCRSRASAFISYLYQ